MPFAQAWVPTAPGDADCEGAVAGAVPVPVPVADEAGVPGELDDELDDEQAASAARQSSAAAAAP